MGSNISRGSLVVVTLDIPLNIPKKTTLYVEQTQRERDHATEMHRHFQRDLCKLRLTTARAYVKIIKDGQVGTYIGLLLFDPKWC